MFGAYRLLNGKFITVQDVLAAANVYNYPIYPSELNIWGWRKQKGSIDRFDDFITVVDKFFDSWRFRIFSATTEAGRWYYEHPLSKEGTASLVPGHYKNAYQLGYHKGKEALIQVGPVVVIRRDLKMYHQGLFGINIHRAGFFSKYIGKWSAGCQVVQREDDFLKLISMAKGYEMAGQRSFSYTLVEFE